MKKFKIIVKKLPIIKAKDLNDAYSKAIDIVNDIGHYGDYKLVEVKGNSK